MIPRARVSYAVSALLCVGVPLLARADRASSAQTAPASSQPQEQTHSRSFVTTHTGILGGTTISYLATAGDTLLSDSNGNPAAAIFSFTYTRQG